MGAVKVKTHKQGLLDSLVDFGPEELPTASPQAAMETEAQRRIRNIVKEMEELNRRIDTLLNSR